MLYTRKIFPEIQEVILRDESIVLTGARQVGKTSLLLLLKHFLEEQGKSCHYLNLENNDHLKALNKHPFQLFELIPESKVKQYVCIDEIQYLDNPTNFLKLLYDEKRSEVKVIASGSSSFYIDKKFKDSLVGRKFLFEVQSLDFDEFLIFSGQNDLLGRKKEKLTEYYREKLLTLWAQYARFGGYPKVVLAEDNEMRRILLEEIGSSYIKKDIADAGIKSAEKYFSLLKILAAQTGQLVNAQELSNTLGVARKTVEEYLYVMEKSYQIGLIKPFYKNIRKELTKMPKVYFYDLGLRNFFLNDYDTLSKRGDKGAYVENMAFRELLRTAKNIDKVRFWRTQDKKEVDFVVGDKAYEIKFNTAKKGDKKSYNAFQALYPNIEFQFLADNEIIKIFYQWKTRKYPGTFWT